MNSYVRAVDDFVDTLPVSAADAAVEGSNDPQPSEEWFQVGHFRAWCLANGMANIAENASMALGQHREAWIAYMIGEASEHPDYILRRQEWGPPAWWCVMDAPMALPQLRQTVREVSNRAVRDMLARVMPAAQRDPAVLSNIELVRRQVAVNLMVLAQIVQGAPPDEIAGWAGTP